MSFFPHRMLGALKQKMLLFVIPESSKLDTMRSSLAITFAVTMQPLLYVMNVLLKHVKKNPPIVKLRKNLL